MWLLKLRLNFCPQIVSWCLFMTWLDLREIHCIEIYVWKLEPKRNELKLYRAIYFRLEDIVLFTIELQFPGV